MSDLKIEWRPQVGPQTEVLRWRIFETFFGGARGGGKSEAGRAWMMIDIAHRKYRGLVIRKNSNDLTDWLDKAREMYTPMGAQFVGQQTEIRFPWGAIIRTGHLNDDNAYEKYQGQEYHRMNIEELTQIEKEENYLKLLSSCRSTIPDLRPRVFATGNPGGKGHEWVKRRFVSCAQAGTRYIDPITKRGRVYIPSRIYDNKILMKADPSYLTFLDGLPEKLRKAWRDGNWDIFSGQFFEEWDERKHVVKPFTIPESWKKFRAIDPSGRNGTTACLWLAIDHDGTVWVYREHYKAGLDIDQHAKEIAAMSVDSDDEKEMYNYTVIDTSAFSKAGYSETAAEIYERYGVTGLVPAAKERIIGWNAVHRYLRFDEKVSPKLRIFSTCVNLIRTIPTAQHDELHPEDVDTSGDDHGIDALRYFLRTVKEQKIDLPPEEIPTNQAMIERRLALLKGNGQSLDYSYARDTYGDE